MKKTLQQQALFNYPPRQAAEEASRLIQTEGDDLNELNHYCFQGKMNLDENFKVLVFDGGTGDNTIYLAEQLKDSPVRLTYLGHSEQAKLLAEARAEIRQLTNIDWVVSESLEEGLENLGYFDFISCTANISHDPDYQKTVAALSAKLTASGVLKLTFNAKYGWQAVNTIQPVIKKLIESNDNVNDSIKLAIEFIKDLPQSNTFKQQFQAWTKMKELDKYPDTGFYHLFMHEHNHCLEVDEIYQLAENAHMTLICFNANEPHTYHPNYMIADPELQALWQDKTNAEQIAIAELYFGWHCNHTFYLMKEGGHTASLDDTNLVPYLYRDLLGANQKISSALMPNVPLELGLSGGCVKINILGSEINKALFEYMDGDHTLEELFNKVEQKIDNVNREQIAEEFQRLYDALNPLNSLLLKTK